MTVLYFSSTGNCLYIAKRIGGNILSIPVCIHAGNYKIEDSEVGITASFISGGRLYLD